MRWVLSSLLIAAMVAFSPPGSAAAYDLRCADNEFVAGFRIKQDAFVRNIALICVPPEQATGVEPSFSSQGVGGTKGANKRLLCGRDEFVSGIAVISRSNGMNDTAADLKAYCTNMDTGRTRTIRTDWRNPDQSAGPYGYVNKQCPQSQLLGRNYLGGINGFAGNNDVQRIEIGCRVLINETGVMDPGEPVRMPPPPPPGAQDTRQRCMDYAQRAALVRATARACGLAGPRYEATVEQHYGWCVASPREHAQAEAEARDNEIAQCRRHGGGNVPRVERLPTHELDYCQLYAQEAVEQANEGQQKCFFNSARYSVYVEDHLNWCKSVPRQTAEMEASARKRELWACQRCRGYAEHTLGQFRRTSECRRPLPSSPIWQPNDYDVHLGWCLQTDRNGERSERPDAASTGKLRERDLRNCAVRPME